MLSKKRKFDDGKDGIETAVKEGLVSLFRQLVPKSEGDISVVSCSNSIAVTLSCSPLERITTQRIRECVAKSGFKLCECSIAFGDKTAKVTLEIGDGEGKQKFEEGPKQEFLSGGKTEDDIRLEHIKHYAMNYLGTQSPPASRVQIEVFESGTKKAWTPEATCKAMEMRISGWEVCSLVHLENFQKMFPCHVEPVQFDNKTVYVTVRTKMYPFCRMFGLKF